MKILLIDNYDSFTYNLVASTAKEGVEVVVVRNDKLDFGSLEEYKGIILSPGPGIPSEAGDLLKIIQHASALYPVLGVCLGHQAIAEYFGGRLENLSSVYHGVSTQILQSVSDCEIFRGLDMNFEAGRYHSWIVDGSSFPQILEITARDDEKRIMALRHRRLPIYGVQFHPESILTPSGDHIIKNFIQKCKEESHEKHSERSL